MRHSAINERTSKGTGRWYAGIALSGGKKVRMHSAEVLPPDVGGRKSNVRMSHKSNRKEKHRFPADKEYVIPCVMMVWL